MVEVRQGSIIKLNLDPKMGHEQSGYRPLSLFESWNS